jgi:hypothetical protein
VKKGAFNGVFLINVMHKTECYVNEEMLDDTGDKLKHSTNKSLARVVQRVHVSRTAACKATKSRPYKITNIQAIKESDYEVL